jgi:hypothetical protein
MSRFTFSAIAGALLLTLPSLRADVPLPPPVLEPATVAEAWNVIQMATRNLETLLAQKRTDELATQVSLCSPALRTLVRLATTAEMKTRLDALAVAAFGTINATAAGGLANDLQRADAAYAALRRTLDEMRALFDPQTVQAEIYYCPEHADAVSPDPQAACAKCAQRLVPRRIPYSFIYTAPGEPTLRPTATADGPIEAGKKVTVKLTLAHTDGRPVLPRDLLVEHTQRIHLLLIDPGLTDFQRHHPEPTATPGEYAFSFAPRFTAPYRVWLDVTPAATGLAELPTVELPSPGARPLVTPMNDDARGAADGWQFRLSFTDRNGTRPRARDTRLLRLNVTDEAGQPVAQLAPYLKAFAHLTGFYDDGQTLLRLHPEGGPVLREDARGGPTLGFRFYPPKAGRVRFFCEVVIEGKRIVAPIELGIAP